MEFGADPQTRWAYWTRQSGPGPRAALQFPKGKTLWRLLKHDVRRHKSSSFRVLGYDSTRNERVTGAVLLMGQFGHKNTSYVCCLERADGRMQCPKPPGSQSQLRF